MIALFKLLTIAWAISGFGGTQPTVVYDPNIPGYAAADVHGQIVHVSAMMIADSTSDKQRKVNVVSSFLHEFAHMRQNLQLPIWELEGGAEAFARDKDYAIIKRMGVKPEHWAYNPWVHKVVKQLGIRWIRKGQFK